MKFLADMGISQSIVSPYSIGIISKLFPEELKATAFSIFNIGVYLAYSLT